MSFLWSACEFWETASTINNFTLLDFKDQWIVSLLSGKICLRQQLEMHQCQIITLKIRKIIKTGNTGELLFCVECVLYSHQIKSDNGFKKSIAICQLRPFGRSLLWISLHHWHFLAVVYVCAIGNEPAFMGLLQADTWNCLATACWTKSRLCHMVASV